MEPLVAAAVIAAVASIINTAISVFDRKKVKETHAQVTVNGGTSHPPTVLDKLSVIEEKVDRTNTKIDNHILWHLDNRIR